MLSYDSPSIADARPILLELLGVVHTAALSQKVPQLVDRTVPCSEARMLLDGFYGVRCVSVVPGDTLGYYV